MFSSIHSQRWLKWIISPKKIIVNLEIKVGSNYTFKDVEVVAKGKFIKALYTRKDVIKLMEQMIKEDVGEKISLDIFIKSNLK